MLKLAVVLVIGLTGLVGRAEQTSTSRKDSPSGPVLHQRLPDIALRDTDNKRHSLSELRGSVAILFFFCGCDRCHDVARLWEPARQSLWSGGKTTPQSINTIVVFKGTSSEAKRFAGEAFNLKTNLIVLTDPDQTVSSTYGARTCPRLFVANASGVLVCTDNAGEHSTQPPAKIVGDAVAAVRDCLRKKG